jgi:acyl-CoA reductase-like NAD-dependent aldehyde dehydrogenase
MPSPWPRSSTRPACRPACSTSSPATARRSAKRWSRTRGGHGVLHRLDRRRQAHLATGRHTVKRVALELGGKSAGIVLDDADFAVAVAKAWSATATSTPARPARRKRACWCRPARYDEAAKSPPTAAASFASAIRSSPTPRSGRWLRRCSRTACATTSPRALPAAAELLAGGTDLPAGVPAGGYYVQPTVFGRVDPGP